MPLSNVQLLSEGTVVVGATVGGAAFAGMCEQREFVKTISSIAISPVNDCPITPSNTI